MSVRSHNLISFALLLSLLVAVWLPTPAAAAVPASADLDPSAYLLPDGTLDVPAGFSGSFDLSGWDVRLHPSRGVVFQPQAAVLGEWSSLDGAGTGLNNFVYTLVFSGGVLYAGGGFTNAGNDPDADYIAQFSGGAWSSLGGANTGLNDVVYAIEFNGGVLYAGGGFSNAGGDTNADSIAQFSGGSWSSLGGAGTGLNNYVFDIAFNGGVLYAGGAFLNAGTDPDADRIAKFSGGAWSSLGGSGTGLNSFVYTLVFNGGVLYAGGNFVNAGNDPNADYIAQFSGGAWSSLGGAGTGLNDEVDAIVFDGGVLYAGGGFTNAGNDPDADRIAQFSGGVWSSLGGADTGLSGIVYSIAFNNGVLYAGGQFTDAGGDPDADYIAQFSGGAWSSLGGAGTGLDDEVLDIEFSGGALYAGGQFTDAGGDPNADRIAQLGLPVPASSSGGSSSSSISKAIAPSGVTSLQLGRLLVSLPANAIPPGQTGCTISATQLDGSAAYGFTLDDVVYDVKVICDGGELNIFLAPLTICIQPHDGAANNKLLYHSHNGGSFSALGSDATQPGYVCGQTRLLSLFTLGQLALPNTGFAPGGVTLAPQVQAYAATSLTLSIPKLGVSLDIVGVPQSPNGWDVSWLGNSQAGYLYGTSFPTWQGNSVLTAHVWNADNTPGPFYALKDLQHGDRFTVSMYGNTYTYEVRTNRLVSPGSLAPLAGSDYSLITLITCESFSEASNSYLHRRAVQAVLISIDG